MTQNSKVSSYDTFKKRIEKWMDKIKDLNDFETLKKETSKIRVKTLRKILSIILIEHMHLDNPLKILESGEELFIACQFNPKQIQKVFHCGKRAAYDYFRFFCIYNKMIELKEITFYKYVAEMNKLREKQDKEEGGSQA